MYNIYDERNYLKELIDNSDTFSTSQDISYSDIEIVPSGTEIKYSNKRSIILDFESQIGMSDDNMRYKPPEIKSLRPNSVILITYFNNDKFNFCFYPFDWIKICSFDKKMSKEKFSVNNFLKSGICLLGGWTPRRKVIFEKIIEHRDKIIISYYPRQSGDWDECHDIMYHNFVDDIVKKHDISYFRSNCISYNNRLFTQNNYLNNYDNSIIYSHLVPKKLYSLSEIQLVAETEDDFVLKEKRISEGFYVTEKTGKALYSGLPWVIYGAEGFLQNLKSLGFETFGDIIDESYDDVRCSFERASRAADSFIEFIKQSGRMKKLALKKVKSRCIRNKNLVSNLKVWTKPVEEQIKKML